MKPRAWRGGPSVAARTSLRSERERAYAEPSEKMVHLEAGAFCSSCGVTVRAGRVHSWDCPDVPQSQKGERP